MRQTLSGIEDITPPSSTGYEEDEEDDETETETNDDEEGFGSQYNIPSQESSDSETEVQGSGKYNLGFLLISQIIPYGCAVIYGQNGDINSDAKGRMGANICAPLRTLETYMRGL